MNSLTVLVLLAALGMAGWVLVRTRTAAAVSQFTASSTASFDSNTELVIVTAHYKEKLDWLKKSKHPVIVCDKPGADAMPFTPDPKCSLNVNRGREASSFLKFIVEYYEQLPKWVAFVHGHETAWHQKLPFGILEAIDRAKRDKFEFINLNNHLHSKVISQDAFKGLASHAPNVEIHHIGHRFLKEYWSIYFEPLFHIPFPQHLRFNCCAQFVVSRNAIQRHPRAAYEELLNMVLDKAHGHDWTLAVAVEFVWHILFGEQPDRCANLPQSECTEDHYLHTRFS